MADVLINDISPRIQYIGNGSVVEFSFPFVIFEETDMLVYLDDVLQSSGYTVTGVDEEDGGEVTFSIAPSNQVVVTLARYVPIERTTEFQEGGAFRAAVINGELDRIAAWSQQLEEADGRTVYRPTTSTSTAILALPDPEAGRTLRWNDTADGIVNGVTTSDIENAQGNAESAALSAGEAQNSADDAKASEIAADASAVLAQQYAESVAQWEVEKIDTSQVVPDDKNGTIWVVDTSGGDVTLTLPSIAAVGEPFTCRVKKADGTANKVTIVPDGTDTIDEGTSFVLDTEGQGIQLDADVDSTPDDWVSSDFGPSVSAALEARVAQNEIDIANNTAAISNIPVGVAVVQLFGEVSSVGAINVGTGFTVTKGARSFYTINFNTPMASVDYVVNLTAWSNTPYYFCHAMYLNKTVNGFDVQMYYGTSEGFDNEFNFTVVK